ncbi:Hsp20/alpha crystallin family protein [Achromobacter xylosoxidans]
MANYPFTDTGVESFFDAVQEQMDRILRGAGLPATLRALPRGHFPPVNIGVSDEAAVVVAFIPGIDPDTLKVSIEKGLLTISGTREAQELPENARYYARERTDGSFTRAIELPADVDADNVQARYVDGCLLVSIKKKESSKPRLIPVQ